MDKHFHKLIEGIIAQNHRLGQKQIAMECVCSALLAQVALLSPAPADALDQMTSELCGTAMGVAAILRNRGAGPEYDSKAITSTIETLTSLSEKVLASKRMAVEIPAWA